MILLFGPILCVAVPLVVVAVAVIVYVVAHYCVSVSSRQSQPPQGDGADIGSREDPEEMDNREGK